MDLPLVLKSVFAFEETMEEYLETSFSVDIFLDFTFWKLFLVFQWILLSSNVVSITIDVSNMGPTVFHKVDYKPLSSTDFSRK